MSDTGIVVEGTKVAFRQKRVDDVRVLVLGRNKLTDPEFDAHLEDALAMAKSVRVVIVMLREGSGGVTAAQRVRLVRSHLVKVPTALLTDSAVVRGMMTAINWLGGAVRPFGLQQLSQAFEFLAIEPPTRARIVQDLAAMTADVH
jgi:hypothetical protein